MTSSTASKAILLPHYKNTRQSPKGEWVLTTILSEDGTGLQSGENLRLGIYPSKDVAEIEVTRYLHELGATKPKLEFVTLPETTWARVAEMLKLPSGEDFVWKIFARSKSDQDVLKFIDNVKRALGRK